MFGEEVMNCVDFETRIAAGEMDEPGVAEHVRACGGCRDFANELAENAAALRSIEVDLAAYTALRARVMAAVRPKRRFGWAWASAAAAVATGIGLIWLTEPLRVPEPPRPLAVYPIPAPPVVREVVVKKKKHVRRPVLLEAIKILTDDPNVVIIWLVDDKKGDSL
jgi:hypothetical protein